MEDEEPDREEQEVQESARPYVRAKKRSNDVKKRNQRKKGQDLHDKNVDRRVKKSTENALRKRKPLFEKKRRN